MSRSAEHVYRILRDMISSGKLKQGSKLTEEEAARLCGVSRTPARDALRRMEREMLVVRRGASAFVRGWSREDLFEMIELRVLLECRAAAKAAGQITSQDLESLTAACDSLLGLLDESGEVDVMLFHKLNYEFHKLLCEIAMGSGYRFIAPLMEEAILYSSLSKIDREIVMSTHQGLENIVRALSYRDPDFAAHAVGTHLKQGYYNFYRQQLD